LRPAAAARGPAAFPRGTGSQRAGALRHAHSGVGLESEHGHQGFEPDPW
jgi:hypothetical protein